jgi:hypothetical protein
MFHTPVGDREGERKRDPDGDRERERKRDPSPTHTGQQKRKREEERTGRISLCIRPERCRAWVLAGNPDDLAKSGRKCRDRKATHTGVSLADTTLHLRHSLPSS